MMKIKTLIAAHKLFPILSANTIRPKTPTCICSVIENCEYYYLNTSLIAFLPDKPIDD